MCELCIVSHHIYVKRVERHFEVEFSKFQLSVNVIVLCTEKQHVWNAEQRDKYERRLRQAPKASYIHTIIYILLFA